MAKKLEDLPIYSRAEDFCGAIDALLERPSMRRNRDLHGQITRANDSILANMEEGFEQGSDRAFANYLTHSKGSVAEVMRRLKRRALRSFSRQPMWMPVSSQERS